MAIAYQAISGIHNLVGILTLLATLIAGGLLVMRSSTSGGGSLALRAALISASTQGTLGILLIILALITFGAGYVGTFWFHYVLGLLSVGVVSVLAGRARRAPDRAVRQYGIYLLATVVLVVVTYYVGMTMTA